MIGDRIERARQAAGLSLRALADSLDISHTAVANYIKGKTTPSSTVLLQFAKALDVRVEYFFRRADVQLQGVEYRKRTTLSETVKKQIIADAEEQLERWLALEEFLPPAWSRKFELPANLPQVITNGDDIERAADTLRQEWNLGQNPIPDLIDTLEEQGLRVITVKGDEEQKFDGFSAHYGDTPVVVVGELWCGDRQRFTLAHELGHLVLHGRLAANMIEEMGEEKACNRFAGAFLAPGEVVRNTLGEQRHWLEFQELGLLKEEFGLSMQAWIFRCTDLGILPQHATKELYKIFRANGWHKQEPAKPYPREETRLFKQRVYRALAEELIGPSKAAELLGISLYALQQCRHMECPSDAANQ
jgi:Zn-dependent peptidase ImmA (M78 family)/DNA-binding XRE family transcriptional regulator